MSKNYLSFNEELRKGDYLVSNNGNFKAVFQDDGNFVIYGWNPTWAAATNSSEAHRLVMQKDSNFVMYKKSGDSMWQTNTHNSTCDTARIHLRDNGNLVLEKDGEDVWSSADSKGMK